MGLSCKRATALISKSMEEPLTTVETVELKLHLFICESCELFRRQVLNIRESLKSKSDDPSKDTELSTEQKEKLREVLKQNDRS